MDEVLVEIVVIAAPALALLALALAAAALLAVGDRRNAGRRHRIIELLHGRGEMGPPPHGGSRAAPRRSAKSTRGHRSRTRGAST